MTLSGANLRPVAKKRANLREQTATDLPATPSPGEFRRPHNPVDGFSCLIFDLQENGRRRTILGLNLQSMAHQPGRRSKVNEAEGEDYEQTQRSNQP